MPKAGCLQPRNGTDLAHMRLTSWRLAWFSLIFGHLQNVGRAVMIRGVDKEFHILFKTQDLLIYAAIVGNTTGNLNDST
jgi:hypothetical protein